MDNNTDEEIIETKSINEQLMNQDLACINKKKNKTTASLSHPSDDKEKETKLPEDAEEKKACPEPTLTDGFMPEENLEETKKEEASDQKKDKNYSEADKLEQSIIGDTQDETVDAAKDIEKTEEEEEEEVFNPAKESAKYSSSDSNSISFQEIQNESPYIDDENKKEKEEISSKDNSSSLKKSFSEVSKNAEEKRFLAGRINKTSLLIIIGVVFLIITIVFNLVYKKKVSGNKKEDTKQTKINVGGYNPDFGDYKNRKYTPTKEEEEIQHLAEVETIISDSNDDKEDFIPLDDEEIHPYYQSTSPSKPDVKTTTYSQAAYDESKDPVVLATKSDIRVKGEGFGIKTKSSYESNSSGSNSSINNSVNNDNPYNLTDEQVANRYLNRVNQLNAINQSHIQNNNDSDFVADNRWSNAGAYNQALKGGDIRTIPTYSLYPGTVIEAVLVNGINTDYPGNITARVISNVYDSKTGKHLLIPSGSIIRGSYSSSSIGVSRVQIAWQSLIMNRDGMDYLVNLGSMVGVDKSGYSGIKGTLSEHAFQYVKAAGLSALFTCIDSNIHSAKKNVKRPVYEEMIDESQEVGNILAEKILDRALDIQPTVKVKPGTRISVDVDKILTLIPYDTDVVVERYVRH